MTTIEDVLKKHGNPAVTKPMGSGLKNYWTWDCLCGKRSAGKLVGRLGAEKDHRLHLGNEIRKMLGQPEVRVTELTIEYLLAEPCENYTSGSCADDDDPRVLGAKYSSEDYCWTCTLRAIVPRKLEEVWDEAAEQTAEWVATNPGPTGVKGDPPMNPYAPKPEPVRQPKCGECRLGLGTHNEADPYCTHYQGEDDK